MLMSTKQSAQRTSNALLRASKASKYFIFNTSQVSKLFFRRSRAANNAVQGWIWSNFDLIRNFKAVLVEMKKVQSKVKVLECLRIIPTPWEVTLSRLLSVVSDFERERGFEV